MKQQRNGTRHDGVITADGMIHTAEWHGCVYGSTVMIRARITYLQ